MKTYLGDCDSLPYGFTHMKKMIKNHYGDEIIIAEINGKSNVVTFTTTASKILHDFHQQSERDDSLREKMRIIETAAKLIKNDIKSVIQSTDYYPISKETSAETAIDFLPESLRALLQIFIPKNCLTGASYHAGHKTKSSFMSFTTWTWSATAPSFFI